MNNKHEIEQELFKEYNETVHKLGAENIHKYNLASIKNFIIHYNNIETDAKGEVYNGILEYLVFISEMETPKRLRDSDQLFTAFIIPLTPSYNKLGFVQFINWKTIIFIGILVDIILMALQCNLWWHFTLIVIMILLKIRVYIKHRQNKLFGLGW